MPTEASSQAAAAKNRNNNLFMRVRCRFDCDLLQPADASTGKPPLATRSSFWIAFRSIVGLAWVRIIQATGKSGGLSAI